MSPVQGSQSMMTSHGNQHRNQHMTGNQHINQILSQAGENQSLRPHLFSTPPSWNSRGPAPNTMHYRPTLDARGNQSPPPWNPRGLALNTIHHRPTLDSSNTVHYRAPVGLTKLKVIPKSALQPINQSTLQPLNLSSLQPINQSALQSIKQSSLQSINQSTLKPINQSTLQPINQSTHQPSQSNAQYMQYLFEGHSIFQNPQTDFQSPNSNRAPIEKKHTKLKTESSSLQNFQAKSKPQNPNPQQTYNDPRLPEGWYLSGVLRQSGVSKGKFDFYIHGMGKRFRSIPEIVRFYDLRSQTGEIEYIDYKVIEDCIKTFRRQLMEQQTAELMEHQTAQPMEHQELKPDAKED